MNILVSSQLHIFIFGIFIGAGLGLLYDCLRIFRRVVAHSKFIIGIEDLIYFLFTSLFIFKYIFDANDGSMRCFIFIAFALGSILYFIIFSNFIVSIITNAIKKVICVVKAIIKFVLKPFTILLRPIFFLQRKAKKDLKKSSKWLIIKFRGCVKEIYFLIKKV